MKRQEVLDQINKTLGSVPGWLNSIPDPQLEHIWGLTAWFLGDSKLSARDKALVAFGAATATKCPYWVPFHTEQLKLSGMGDAEIIEAANAVQQSVGFSAYLHGIDYDVSKFKQELNSTVKYIKSQARTPARAGSR